LIFGKTHKQKTDAFKKKKESLETITQFFALWPRKLEDGQYAWMCKVWRECRVWDELRVTKYYTIKKPE